jgi:alpha-tubulin suppressor-like RCC1 family protein
LTEDGLVYALGANKYGQLGTGNTQPCTSPTLVKALSDHNICAIACGNDHSLAISESGSLYTFGHGNSGQLGHGNKEDQHSPKLVESLKTEKIVKVSGGGGLGNAHSLVISGTIFPFFYKCRKRRIIRFWVK